MLRVSQLHSHTGTLKALSNQECRNAWNIFICVFMEETCALLRQKNGWNSKLKTIQTTISSKLLIRWWFKGYSWEFGMPLLKLHRHSLEFCLYYVNIDSSTIDDKGEFGSQYNCIMTSQVSTQFLCPTKLLIIIIIILE